jgi:ABC-2 type transport system ATP-binding protein
MNKAPSLLTVTSLKAGYSKKSLVVNDVSFDVRRGEVLGLVGLNGAGKTTLIKTILGLREQIEGEILCQDKNNIAYLPEKFEPPYFLTGENFIHFSLSLYSKKISSEEVHAAAKSVSLDTGFLNKGVQTYSKGMRQKLGLLATILTGCDLLVLDEPMSGLDPKARQEVKKMIVDVRGGGRSILMCSHILADISELCDRVAVFHQNRIIFLGTPEVLEDRGGDKSLEKAFLNLIEGKNAA